MNIWDNLAAGAYTNSDPGPSKPHKPRLRDGASPSEIRAYADSLDAYEYELQNFKQNKAAWYTRSGELEAQFQKDLEAHYEMTGHPKASLLYSKAWERGHSAGLHDVACVYADLVELVK